MPDSGLVEWLQSKGFYAMLVLGLIALALLLARGAGRQSHRQHKRTACAVPRRGRPKRNTPFSASRDRARSRDAE